MPRKRMTADCDRAVRLLAMTQRLMKPRRVDPLDALETILEALCRLEKEPKSENKAPDVEW